VKLRWRLAWIATYPIAKLLLNLRVKGREKLPPGPLILASNHVSNVDPVIVGWAAARELHFFAKEELFTGPKLFTWLIKFWNAWPVSRSRVDPTAIKRFVHLLGRRQTVVLFPEGTRSKTGDLAGFKPGVGMLAIGSHAPIVPTLTSGMEGSWTSYLVDKDFVRRGFRKKPARPATVRVVFGDPVEPHEFERSKDGYVEMTRIVEQEVRKLKRNVECRMPDVKCEEPSEHRQER